METPDLTVEIKSLEEIRKAKQIKTNNSENTENQDSSNNIMPSKSLNGELID